MKKSWFFLLLLLAPVSHLNAIELISTQQEFDSEYLVFTPQFELQLSQKVIDAIDNGIVITFVSVSYTHLTLPTKRIV